MTTVILHRLPSGMVRFIQLTAETKNIGVCRAACLLNLYSNYPSVKTYIAAGFFTAEELAKK